MQQILDAVLSGTATPEDFEAIAVPESYRAVTVHKDEQEIFAGMASRSTRGVKGLSMTGTWVRARNSRMASV